MASPRAVDRSERMGVLPKATLVVPCYNEARRLCPDAFVQAMQRFPSLAFLFVDDGSSDETFEVLGTLCAAHPQQAHVVRLARNGGKGEAVRQGVLRAFEQDPEVVGYWDADLATPLDEWAPMARLLESSRAAIVLGSRVKLLGRTIERDELRHYMGRVFATAVSQTLRLPVYDTQCGAKLFRVSDLTRRLFAEPFASRWIFDVEILARALRLRERTENDRESPLAVEYPLHSWIDVKGSKLRWHDFAHAAGDLAKIALYLRRGGRANGKASGG